MQHTNIKYLWNKSSEYKAIVPPTHFINVYYDSITGESFTGSCYSICFLFGNKELEVNNTKVIARWLIRKKA